MKVATRVLRVLIPLSIVVFLAVSPVAFARVGIYNDWDAFYPASESDDNMDTATGKICQLCHETSSGGGTWNPYGYAIKAQIDLGLTNEQAFAAIESANSDGDPPQPPFLPNGWTNALEIQYHGQPGWTTGSNNIYDADGNIVGTASPPAGVQVEPSLTVDVHETTWGRLKRFYDQ